MPQKHPEWVTACPRRYAGHPQYLIAPTTNTGRSRRGQRGAAVATFPQLGAALRRAPRVAIEDAISGVHTSLNDYSESQAHMYKTICSNNYDSRWSSLKIPRRRYDLDMMHEDDRSDIVAAAASSLSDIVAAAAAISSLNMLATDDAAFS